MAIIVLQAGPLTTVQDLGRFGYQKDGIPCSGVMDQQAYRTANELLGNCRGEAVLEHTLFGGSYLFTEDTILALTGADMGAVIQGRPCSAPDSVSNGQFPAASGAHSGRRPCPPGQPIWIRAGETLSLGAAKNGCRTYLAIAGGFDTPPVLGSRSTNLKCGFGGYEGRALRTGDRLRIGTLAVFESGEVLAEGNKCVRPEEAVQLCLARYFEEIKDRRAPQLPYETEVTVRVIEGPQDDFFTAHGLDTFYSSAYTVSEQSDRMGCRLEGAPVESLHGTDIISDGVVFGSIQVTSSGQPIVLMADRQTTGGYAKIATVLTEDLPLLAQARPGSTVHFQKYSKEDFGYGKRNVH